MSASLKSDELLRTEALIAQRHREVFERLGISVNVTLPTSPAKPGVAQQRPIIPDVVELSGPTAVEQWIAAQSKPKAEHIPAPTPEEGAALVEEMNSALANRHAPEPQPLDEPALRDALRQAIAARDDKLRRLAEAESVLANSQSHVDAVHAELRSYLDLDHRVAESIADALRDRGRADVPPDLQQLQRHRAIAVERQEHLTKAHTMLTSEVAQRRAELTECEAQMRKAANAVLSIEAQHIAQGVERAEAQALSGRQQLVALASMQIDLPHYVVHILTRDVQMPRLNEPADGTRAAILEQWQAVRDQLCADPDAEIAP